MKIMYRVINGIMCELDLPVCTVAAHYEEVVNIPTHFLDDNIIVVQSKFWGKNAIEFYNLNSQ